MRAGASPPSTKSVSKKQWRPSVNHFDQILAHARDIEVRTITQHQQPVRVDQRQSRHAGSGAGQPERAADAALWFGLRCRARAPGSGQSGSLMAATAFSTLTLSTAGLRRLAWAAVDKVSVEKAVAAISEPL